MGFISGIGFCGHLLILSIIVEITIGFVLLASYDEKKNKPKHANILVTIGCICLAYQIVYGFL